MQLTIEIIHFIMKILHLQKNIFEDIKENLKIYFKDTENSFYLQSDGTWKKSSSKKKSGSKKASSKKAADSSNLGNIVGGILKKLLK